MAAYSAASGTRANLWHTVDINSQNAGANTSSLHVVTYIEVHDTSGITNNAGDASWGVNTAGSGSRGSNFTYNAWGNGNHVLDTFDITVGHDTNGNCTVGVSASVNGANSPFFTSASISTSLGLPRLALAPTIAAITADTITSTSARLGAETSSYGHGTSATWTMYYRLQGAGGWTSAGSVSDGPGYDYWNLTGLQPGKTYEYYATSANNNGDTATSGTQTFSTLPVAGATIVMMKLAGL